MHWYNELMWHPLLLLYWVNYFQCHHMYNQLILLNFDEMIFFTWIVFVCYLIIGTNTWICISFFLKYNECIKGSFGMYIDTRKVWTSYNIITVWCIKVILFSTVNVWVNSSTYPLLRNVWNLPSLFPSWQHKHHDLMVSYLTYARLATVILWAKQIRGERMKVETFKLRLKAILPCFPLSPYFCSPTRPWNNIRTVTRGYSSLP